ncbi:deoxyribonucleotide triphosphate pyrophosphatase [Porphyromonas macacae]|uniref:non-canonical purine NTP diphosphatase n=1 Tax=Porphyromonas macacae TaxID=28115 RepID=UPI00052B5A87|nr:non-canonical purine NTP diphosphatase [Porphyromonas macacae]KGN99550.1 deoxyribonucleotide triphosphate pyrophosphatase [Porphyromonas macacae]
MEKLVFATNNLHKLSEIRHILSGSVEVLSLADINCHDDIPETAETLEGNALIKARHIYDKYGLYCFADDTGLAVDALNGAPGVYSARYAGPACNFVDNMNKLLVDLGDNEHRKAVFSTVIVLIDRKGEHCFRGDVRGEITTEPRGKNGFGYDPVFMPDGYKQTYAEMSDEEKNAMSHRALATRKLVAYLIEKR